MESYSSYLSSEKRRDNLKVNATRIHYYFFPCTLHLSNTLLLSPFLVLVPSSLLLSSSLSPRLLVSWSSHLVFFSPPLLAFWPSRLLVSLSSSSFFLPFAPTFCEYHSDCLLTSLLFYIFSTFTMFTTSDPTRVSTSCTKCNRKPLCAIFVAQ